jgi:hypothetical protein
LFLSQWQPSHRRTAIGAYNLLINRLPPEHGNSPAYQFSEFRQHLRRQGDLTKFEFRYADAILMESIYKEIPHLIQFAQPAGIFQDRLIFGNGIVHSRHTV